MHLGYLDLTTCIKFTFLFSPWEASGVKLSKDCEWPEYLVPLFHCNFGNINIENNIQFIPYIK